MENTAFKLGLGRAIAARRKKKDLSQGGLAAVLGVTRQAVGYWELGASTCRLEGLPGVAAALDMTTVELVRLACKLGGCQ